MEGIDMEKKHLEYVGSWIKTDLQNTINMLQPPQQIEYLNAQLQVKYITGLVMQTDEETKTEGIEICNTIIKYRDEQNKNEKIAYESQKKIMENANNITKHLLGD